MVKKKSVNKPSKRQLERRREYRCDHERFMQLADAAAESPQPVSQPAGVRHALFGEHAFSRFVENADGVDVQN